MCLLLMMSEIFVSNVYIVGHKAIDSVHICVLIV